MKDLVSSFTATFTIQACNIVSAVLLARFLLPDGRGELATVMLWSLMITAFGSLALHESVAYHAAQRRYGEPAILVSSLMLGCGLSLLLVPIGWLALDLVLHDSPPEVREASLIYLALIPLNLFGLLIVGLFQGSLRFIQWNVLRTLLHVAYTLLIPVFYWLGWGTVTGFAVASLLAHLCLVLAGLLWAAREGWVRRAAPAAPARDLIGYGARVHVGAVVSILNERLDQMVISVALAAADFGHYVVAASIARPPTVVAVTFSTVAFTKIAAQRDSAGQADTFARYCRATILTVLPITVALGVAVPWILQFFFGASFLPAMPLAWALLPATVAISVKVVLNAGLKAIDRTGLIARGEAVGLVLMILSLAVLVPTLGVLGAACAMSLAQGGIAVFLLRRIGAAFGVPLRRLLVPHRADLAVLSDFLATLRRAG